jgi:branched-chain amino acid transport system substrate-binding protein
MAYLSPSKRHSILISSLIIFGLTGLVIFGVTRTRQDLQRNAEGNSRLSANRPSPKAPSEEASPGFNLGRILSFGQNQGIEQRLSLGDKILVNIDNNPDKQEGIKLFQAGKYDDAIQRFNDSLALNRNDPEAWIYLNNAMAAVSGTPIKMAVSVPIGGNVNVAKEILRGVAQFQYEVNNGGRIQGKLLQIVVANDDNSPTLAKQIASDFVADPEILAVIGHNSSDASLAAAPIYQAGGLVMISPTSIARNLSGIGSYIFRTTPNSRAVANTLAKYSMSVNRGKIGICTDSSSQASQSYKEEFIAAIFENNGQIIRTNCDFSATDFDPDEIPSRMVGDGANTLLLIPSVDRLNPALDIIRANRGRLALLGNHTLYTYETLAQGLNNAKGMVLSVFWHPAAIRGNSFPEKAKKLWGGYGSWRTAMSYDAVKVAVTGLNNSSSLSREQLQKTISNPGFSTTGATGSIRFESIGDRHQPGTLVKIQPGKNSGTGYDFVPFPKIQSETFSEK